ncbi:hypothetical protein [Hydrogenophaga sp. 5NK40-0174]|uniref:(2Fe-2S)-binding protein n=1 Tax=Hydrogenophaga sp. 5NK40-0174 TaxID=3127649 RepID=UPI003340D778
MDFDDLQLEYGVATQCGKCEGCARSIWSECAASQSLAHIRNAVLPREPKSSQPA